VDWHIQASSPSTGEMVRFAPVAVKLAGSLTGVQASGARGVAVGDGDAPGA